MKKNFIYFILLNALNLFLFSACAKDEWTKPAQVNLEIELNSQDVDIEARKAAGARQSKNDHIKIEKIQYRIAGIDFEGYRENGENYFFTRDFEEGKVVEVNAGSSSSVLTFDMPQGLYERVNISLLVKKSKENSGSMPYNKEAAILMFGYYTNTRDQEIPLVFVYDFDEVFTHAATPAGPAQDIAIKQSQPNIANISFDMPYWMQLINGRMLQGAELSMVNAEPTIIISAQKNEHIFNLLTSRIKNVKRLVFK